MTSLVGARGKSKTRGHFGKEIMLNQTVPMITRQECNMHNTRVHDNQEVTDKISSSVKQRGFNNCKRLFDYSVNPLSKELVLVIA